MRKSLSADGIQVVSETQARKEDFLHLTQHSANLGQTMEDEKVNPNLPFCLSEIIS
jgi:hypothetical protein